MVNHFFLHDEWLNSHKLHLYTDAVDLWVLGQFLATTGALVSGPPNGKGATLPSWNSTLLF